MRLILDTNILIQIEDPKILPVSFQEILSIIRENGHKIFISTSSFEDIKNDINEDRRNITLSKLKGYPQLESPSPDNEFLSKIGSAKKKNERIDNHILYLIYKNAAEFLITEDKQILNKAKILNLEDRILNIEQALNYLKEIHNRKIPNHTLLKEVLVQELDDNDSFFDELKGDYPEFITWFNKIKREGRKAWRYLDSENRIKSLMILKEEINEEIASNPPLEKAKRLKICLLKSESGNKIGELLLKLAFQYCTENKFSEIYLTHFKKEEDQLVYLIEKYGFKFWGNKIQKNTEKLEGIWLKKFEPPSYNLSELKLTPLEFSNQYYPKYIDSEDIKKYVVPIKPQYHNRLFPDYKDRQMNLTEYCDINIPGNAIKKAYMCHSKIKSIRAGDILLFYRSKDQSKITSLGIVESATILVDIDSIIRAVGKRTVYTYEEVKKLALQPVLILLFKHHLNLPKSVNLRMLIKNEILKAAPQSILQLEHSKYQKLMQEADYK